MDQKLKGWLCANRIKMFTNVKLGGVILFFISHQARALICIYMLSHKKHTKIHFILRRFLRSHYHIECSCKKIGSGFKLPHPRNIIIAAEEIGNDVQINQNTTIGGNMQKVKQRDWGIQKLPIIRNKVVIYTNAVVGGPIIINDNVIIGANCTCTHDVKSNTLIYNKQMESSKQIEVLNGTYKYIE